MMKSSRNELPPQNALVIDETGGRVTEGSVISKYHALYGEIFWDYASEEQCAEYRAAEAYFEQHGRYPP